MRLLSHIEEKQGTEAMPCISEFSDVYPGIFSNASRNNSFILSNVPIVCRKIIHLLLTEFLNIKKNYCYSLIYF